MIYTNEFTALNPVIEVQDFTSAAIRENPILKSHPFVSRGYALQWPAFEKWNYNFLCREFGDTLLKATRHKGNDSESKMFSLSEYIQYMQLSESPDPYYLSNCQFHLGSILQEDYTAPESFRCWYNTIPRIHRKHSLSWIFIAASHTYSSLHKDIWNTAAWNALISGEKLWVFIPNASTDFLPKNTNNYFQFKDVAHLQSIGGLYCIQKPGDLVYTPSDWWHTVYNLQSGISITENFINELNYQFPLEYFRGRNKNNFELLQNLIQQNLINENAIA